LFSMQSRWCADVVREKSPCLRRMVCFYILPFAIVCDQQPFSIYLLASQLLSSIRLFTFTGLVNDSSRPVSSEDGTEASASNVVDTSHCHSTRMHSRNHFGRCESDGKSPFA